MAQEGRTRASREIREIIKDLLIFPLTGNHFMNLAGFIIGGLDIALLKPTVGILVQQTPQQAWLYLFYLNPRISEVIIHKNAEPGRNNCGFSGGNGGGRI